MGQSPGTTSCSSRTTGRGPWRTAPWASRSAAAAGRSTRPPTRPPDADTTRAIWFPTAWRHSNALELLSGKLSCHCVWANMVGILFCFFCLLLCLFLTSLGTTQSPFPACPPLGDVRQNDLPFMPHAKRNYIITIHPSITSGLFPPGCLPTLPSLPQVS